MHISLSWLRKYTHIPHETLLEDLSLHTSEVESIVKQKGIEHVVIGHVLSVEAHPNADKLRIAKVQVSDEEVKQIVCGAKNLEVGQKVPVALPGAMLAPDFIIKSSELRGVLSDGMICSEDELGLAKERAEGILVLPTDAPIGVNVFSYLAYEDIILEIDNKSITNRPDLFGHYGLARECAVIYKQELKPYLETSLDFSKFDSLPKIPVTLEDPTSIRRYMAVVLENIRPTTSPMWLKAALEKVGIQSINSIVDITNYIMLDAGQPMHAYDADTLKFRQLHIGFLPHPEEELTTLDGQERSISNKVLLIKDQNTPIALAGIMGLKNTEVSSETSSILLEAGVFTSSLIRKGAQALSLRTEASMRFEKNLDPEMTSLALEKAIDLLLQIHPEARVASAITDIYPAPTERKTIRISHDFLENRIGQPLEKASILDTLMRLGFEVTEDQDLYALHVPSWRSTGDISLPEDIVEELTRMIGFGSVTPSIPVLPITPNEAHRDVEFRTLLKNILSTQGNLQEVQHYSFYSKEDHKNALLSDDTVLIMNPLSSEQEVMRTHLVPHLFKTVRENLKHREQVSAFELNHVYPKVEGKFWDEKRMSSYEIPHLACIAAHTLPLKDEWSEHPFFHLKAIFTDLLETLHTKKTVQYIPLTDEERALYGWVHPSKSALIKIDDICLGVIGAVHPLVQKNFDMEKAHVAALEIDIQTLEKFRGEIKYHTVSQFPTVARDFAFLMPMKMYVGEVLETISKSHPFIQSVSIKDIYTGEKVAENMKSVTYALSFNAETHTLKDQEIQEIVIKLLKDMEEKYQITLRS